MDSLLSDKEAKRLAALANYNIVDSLPEKDYEDITLLAAQICDTPVALISLVDQSRQWFKSNRGLSFRQTPREQSFCAHNLQALSSPLVVEDARQDERFQHNPLVTGEPHIVFYAGYPLIDDDGLTLGSLCVIDSQVRQLDEGQLRALNILAHQVVTLLTARRKAIQEAHLREQLRMSEARFQDLVLATSAATAIFIGRDMLIQQVNPPMLAIWGKDESVLGKTIHMVMPGLEGQFFLAQLQHVFDTGQSCRHAESLAYLIVDGQPKAIYVNQAYNPLFDQEGHIYGVISTAIDVTQQVMARQALAESEARFNNIIQQSPAATLVLRSEEFVIDQANMPMLAFIGRGEEVIGQPLLAVIPELEEQFVWQQLQRVYHEGISFDQKEVLVPHNRTGLVKDYYYDVAYRPLREQGVVTGVIQVVTDVTEHVQARRKLEESEAKLSLLSNTVPSMIFYLDQQQRYVSYNQTFQDWFGVDATQAIGQSVREFIGESSYGQVAPHLAVAYAGQPERYELPAPSRFGKSQWLDITYTPHHNEAGELLGVIVLANDISAQIQARKALEESNYSLQNAIEVGGLGTFSVAIDSNQLTCSARLAEWFGFDRLTVGVEAFLDGVDENERDYVRGQLQSTLLAGADGRYDVIHSIINAKTGLRVLIHALGRVYSDESGKPLKIEGIAQDITAQREWQQIMEAQVQQRTQELSLANQDLQRSNANLKEFAYVASHDLQEPLRKIQSFSTLLTQHLGNQLDATAIDYLERITKSGSRMSTLIRDLLSYSRIATRQQRFGPVSIQAIVSGVLEILSLEIEHRQAQVEVSTLPVLNGDGSQLSQLFQNLLSNALKFTPTGQRPRVRIASFCLPSVDLPATISLDRSVPFYYQISVSDEGIGFDTKYLDRIFQVFQRLHSKSEFAGTGVGLAIVQRVAENHSGGITARSKPGEGATFYVYLPA